MEESTPVVVAFDQHAVETVAAVLQPGQRVPALQTLASESRVVVAFVRQVQRQGPVRCCYEAGPCGFELARALRAAGIAGDVIAPALIPRRVGARIKTDRRDAAQLALLYQAQTLTAVHVPTEPEEAARDLLRCREDIRADLLRARHRLSKYLLRHGRRYPGGHAWTQTHRRWLTAQTWALPAASQTHDAYQRAIDEAEARLRSVEADLQELVTLAPLKPRVERLRCFRGIDQLTALTIAAEIGDPRRFPGAPQLMAFVGLIPSEHSSGLRQARGAITKTGNAHLRRVLVEAAWHYRHGPAVGAALRTRQAGAPRGVIDQAWTAQQRLHRKYQRLRAKGKPAGTVVTAVARELTGFVWAALVS